MKIDRWIVPRRYGQKLSLEVVSIWHSSFAVGVAAVAKTNTRKTEIDLETETERNNFRLR